MCVCVCVFNRETKCQSETHRAREAEVNDSVALPMCLCLRMFSVIWSLPVMGAGDDTWSGSWGQMQNKEAAVIL